jgi:hypothetical protein
MTEQTRGPATPHLCEALGPLVYVLQKLQRQKVYSANDKFIPAQSPKVVMPGSTFAFT